ncbi:MAG: SWI SNF, matrix associated, actin dependent regulator of chromatin, subfamily d, member 2 [Marteilia pararefringens]
MIIDRSLPKEVIDICPEASLYEELVKQEHQIDSTIMRNKYSMLEELRQGQNTKSKSKLVVKIQTTVNLVTDVQEIQKFLSQNRNVVPQLMKFDNNTHLIYWDLKITGSLENMNEVNSSTSQPPINTTDLPSKHSFSKKLSNYFHKIILEIEKGVYNEDINIIEWKRTNSQELDGFQFRRFGLPKNVGLQIIFDLDHVPQLFKLDSKLANVLGIDVVTKSGFFTSIWQYIVSNQLLDDKQPNMVNLNSALKQIFQIDQLTISDLIGKIHALLRRPEPMIVHHVIPTSSLDYLDKNNPVYKLPDLVVKFDVGTENRYSDDIKNWLLGLKEKSDFEKLDIQIEKCLDNIRQASIAYNFFTDFSQNPIEFFREWMVSQQNDMRIMKSGIVLPDISDDEGNSIPASYMSRDDLLNSSKCFQQPWVVEAVRRYAADNNQYEPSQADNKAANETSTRPK